MTPNSRGFSFFALLIAVFFLGTISPALSSPTFKWRHGRTHGRLGAQVLSPDQKFMYIYVGLEPDNSGNFIRAVDTDTGSKLWQIEAPARDQSFGVVGEDGTIYGSARTKLVDGRRVSVDTTYRAWAPAETTPIWIDGSNSQSKTVPAVHNRKDIVYLGYKHALKAVSADSGIDLGIFQDFDTGPNTGLGWGVAPVITPHGRVIIGVGSSEDVPPSERATPEVISLKYDSSAPSGFQVEWRYEPQGRPQSHFALNPVRTPPHVYVPDTNTVYALDMITGEEQWTYELDGSVDAHDIGSSPVVGPDGTVYIGDGTEQLYAINPDGTTKWVTPLDIPNGTRPLGTPTVARSDTGTMIFVGTDHGGSNWSPTPGRVVALNGQGDILWKRKQPAPNKYPNRYFWEVIYAPTVMEDGTLITFSHSDEDWVWALQTSANGMARTPWPIMRQNTSFDAEADTVATTSSSTTGSPLNDPQACLMARISPVSAHDDLRSYRDGLLEDTAGRYLVKIYYRYLGASREE